LIEPPVKANWFCSLLRGVIVDLLLNQVISLCHNSDILYFLGIYISVFKEYAVIQNNHLNFVVPIVISSFHSVLYLYIIIDFQSLQKSDYFILFK
jgi:ABC-type methionine transport system permease subunit